jgi:OOP family OmpA-OmpF porin
MNRYGIRGTFASVVATALFALGCVSTTLPTQAPLAVSPIQFGAGEVRGPDQAIVITDSSGTMFHNQTFPEAKALTQSFVAAMPAKDSSGYDASLIGFGGDDRITSPLQAFDRGALANTAASLRILGDLDGYGGRTPLHNVMGEVRGALTSKSDHAAVVLFSDGLPDDGAAAIRGTKALAAAYSGKVCIHTVHTGDDPLGSEFLAILSKVTGCGTAREASSVNNPAAFTQFVRDVFVVTGDQPNVCSGVIRLRGVEFEFDKAVLTPTSQVVLDAAADGLRACPNVPVRIEGHTDSLGSEEYNQGLGQRRADAVRNYLVKGGVVGGKITARSYGETRPIATNDTDEGRALNQRVELHADQ